MSAEHFAYWYISVVLIALGLTGVVANRYLSDLKPNFWFELRDPIVRDRLSAVLERRRELEGLGRRPILVASISYLICGLLCALHFLNPAIAYGLACADSALVLAFVFARVRNRSQRRAASLAPRRAISIVPLPAYAGALITSFVPLLLTANPDVRVAAILTTLSSLVILAAAWFTAGMAAILAGDDIEIELYVDDRVRRARVCSMLSFSYAVVPVFVAIATPAAITLPTFSYALVLSLVLMALFLTWYGIDFLSGRMTGTNGA
jgi:hypothetical protein